MKLKDQKILLEAIGDGTDDFSVMVNKWKDLKNKEVQTFAEWKEQQDTKEDKA